MPDDQQVIYVGPFECLECGKHVSHSGRSASPWRVLRSGEKPEQWNFCSRKCMGAYTTRWNVEHPED